MSWWWPFKRKPQNPLDKWLDSYEAWLTDLQKVLADFPDHTPLEGARLSEVQGRLLDQISDLYGDDVREALEKLVLRGAQLRKASSANILPANPPSVRLP